MSELNQSIENINYINIINSFLELKNLNKESYIQLNNLKFSLTRIAPEILMDKFFNGTGSHPGLCDILSNYEENNNEAKELYISHIKEIKKKLDQNYITY